MKNKEKKSCVNSVLGHRSLMHFRKVGTKSHSDRFSMQTPEPTPTACRDRHGQDDSPPRAQTAMGHRDHDSSSHHRRRLPMQASTPPRFRTRSALLAHRKRQDLPDASLDVDGDGVVSQRDYFLAHRFTERGSDRLSAEQLAAARDAVKHGLEDEFEWNDGAGLGIHVATETDKKSRKQGWMSWQEVIDADVVAQAKARTRSSLMRRRKDEFVAENERAAQKHARQAERVRSAREQRSAAKFAQSVGQMPSLEAVRRRRREREEQARVEHGLAARTSGVDPEREKMELTLGYTPEPAHRSRSSMRKAKKKQLLREYEQSMQRALSRKQSRRSSSQSSSRAAESSGDERGGRVRSRSALREQRRQEDLQASSKWAAAISVDKLPRYAGSGRPYFVEEEEAWIQRHSKTLEESMAGDDEDVRTPSRSRARPAQSRRYGDAELYFRLPPEDDPLPQRPGGRSTLVQKARRKKRLATPVHQLSVSAEERATATSKRVHRPPSYTLKWFQQHGFDGFTINSELGRQRLQAEQEESMARERQMEATMTCSYSSIPLYSSFTKDGIFREPSYMQTGDSLRAQGERKKKKKTKVRIPKLARKQTRSLPIFNPMRRRSFATAT